MRCDKCGADVPETEIQNYYGQKLCEDCYIDVLSRPKACDPGAVMAARTSRQMLGLKGTQGLTPLQRKIYNFLKEKGKATHNEVANHLGISREELEKQFAVLRHCELVRGFKDKNTIYLTLM